MQRQTESNPNPPEPRPLVTAVITTRDRPSLVVRAVRSALNQTYAPLEVIVVIDGADSVTAAALADAADARLRVLQLDVPRGANNARNAGIMAAGGEWIAFLDDDDEWLPNKTAAQIELAATCTDCEPIVSCRFFVLPNKRKVVWPRRLPRPGETFGDYMYLRRALFDGDTALRTSTLLARRSLLRQVQFAPALRKHQEVDLVFRAIDLLGARLLFTPEPLAVWYRGEPGHSISNRNDWRHSWEWIRGHRQHLSKRAYSGFLLTSLSAVLARERAWDAVIPVLREAFVFGDPSFLDVVLFATMWAVPPRVRRSLATFAKLQWSRL